MYSSKGRKRSNSEDEEMLDGSSQRQQVCCRYSKDTKRFKTSIQRRSARDAMLNTMDKDTLIHIINSILNTHPEVRQNVISLISPPTINSALGILLDMEKQLVNSFPYNRNGLGRDDYTFSRVREYLTQYIDTIVQYATHFTSCSYLFPTTCFSFLDHATYMAHRLPIWDNSTHNSLKSNLYHHLAGFWKISIESAASKLRENEYYSSDSVNAWAKSLIQHNNTSNGAFTEAMLEFTKQFMIRLQPVCHPTSLETSSASIVGTSIENI